MKNVSLQYISCLIILIFCLCESCATKKGLSSHLQKINDTIRFNQICIDTIYLTTFKPTDEGLKVLDKILSTKHQNFLKYPEGTFMISEEAKVDPILTFYFLDRNINFFAQHGWNSFKGIVCYRGKVFLIWNDVSDESINILFENTGLKQGFPDFSDKLYVKVDEKITWRFVRNSGEFSFMSVYPPSTVFDFDFPDFEE